MCGIYFSIDKSDFLWPDAKLKYLLHSRGPDSQHSLAFSHPQKTSAENSVCLAIQSTVLSLRGDQVVSQPLQDEAAGLVLCWNGEAWKIGECPISGNDAQVIFHMLITALTQHVASSTDTRQVVITQLLASVAGPFSFVLFDQISGQVHFGRDRLGRRSLLQCQKLDSFSLCSLGTWESNDHWSEVATDGFYVINLTENTPQNGNRIRPIIQSWSSLNAQTHCSQNQNGSLSASEVIWQGHLNKELPTSDSSPLTPASYSVHEIESNLRHSLQLRILDIPSTHPNQQAEMLTSMSKIAILFSGGLDCSLIARVSHELLPCHETIDLLNVAFENPRIHNNISSPFETCPDRITGHQSVEELRRVCPNRTWRFVEIDVPYSETIENRQTIIELMKPHNTEMDLSIALALYFAARGIGKVQDAGTATRSAYRTPARVLLSGLGADELFGGYQRHATAFARSHFEGLLDELNLDISRIGKRNLGRDDRVISHWGREVRYPYLDETLFAWAMATPVWQKCGFWTSEWPHADGKSKANFLEPGKKLLRLLACKLGMQQVANEKKRAVGSMT